jgi:hypothetical protein
VPKEWEQYFPNLGSWKETSAATDAYNCTAFAAFDENRWWDPIPLPIYYWPPDLPNDYALSTYIELFKTLGYRVCADGTLEPNSEKIVIYTNDLDLFEHVARQLPDGNWTSKIGGCEDIMHEKPDSLAGDEYGRARCFMARTRKPDQ